MESSLCCYFWLSLSAGPAGLPLGSVQAGEEKFDRADSSEAS